MSGFKTTDLFYILQLCTVLVIYYYHEYLDTYVKYLREFSLISTKLPSKLLQTIHVFLVPLINIVCVFFLKEHCGIKTDE